MCNQIYICLQKKFVFIYIVLNEIKLNWIELNWIGLLDSQLNSFSLSLVIIHTFMFTYLYLYACLHWPVYSLIVLSIVSVHYNEIVCIPMSIVSLLFCQSTRHDNIPLSFHLCAIFTVINMPDLYFNNKHQKREYFDYCIIL